MPWKYGKRSRNLCIIQHVVYGMGNGKEPYYRNEQGAICVNVKFRLLGEENEPAVWDTFWFSSARTHLNFSSRVGYFLAAVQCQDLNVFNMPIEVVNAIIGGKVVHVATYQSRKGGDLVLRVKKWGYYPVVWSVYFRENYTRIMNKHGYTTNPYHVAVVRRKIGRVFEEGESTSADPVVPDPPLPNLDFL